MGGSGDALTVAAGGDLGLGHQINTPCARNVNAGLGFGKAEMEAQAAMVGSESCLPSMECPPSFLC